MSVFPEKKNVSDIFVEEFTKYETELFQNILIQYYFGNVIHVYKIV